MKTRFWNAGIADRFRPCMCFCACAVEHRRRLNSGGNGAVPSPPEFRRRPIRLSNGARRRTFAGRSRFRAEVRGRLSSGAIGSI